MKTKFSQIVKVKKRVLEDIEIKIVTINNEISTISSEIDELTKKIQNPVKPEGGDFFLMQMALEEVSNFRRAKMQKQKFLEGLESNLKRLKLEYKLAHMEYEKIKHLEELEIDKSLKKLKKLESKEMDEISMMLFNNNKAVA